MENYIGKTCPFCKTEITETDAVKVCPACGIPHHEGCWDENHGCTTFGCSEQHYEAQHTNPTDVCSNCGAPLGDGQAFCPKCGTPKGAPKKNICGKCGNELQDGQEFCPLCGQKAGLAIDVGVSSAINQFNANMGKQNQKKTSKISLIIGLAIVSVIAVVLVIVLSSGPKVDEIVLDNSSVELRVGDTLDVDYSIEPADAEDIEVSWETSDKSVATVDSDGTIKGQGEGSCTITATAGDKSDTVNVTVITITREEKKLLGTWNSIGYLDEYEDYKPLISSAGKFYAYDDFTGKMTAGDTTLYFTWKYIKYDDGNYYYQLKLTTGGTLQCFMMKLDNEDSVVVPMDEMAIIFQK